LWLPLLRLLRLLRLQRGYRQVSKAASPELNPGRASVIDIHNHLLPGLDDGAPDMGVALALARMAVEEGIRYMVCTPHIQPGRFDNDLQSISRAHDAFATALSEAGIPLRTAFAAEVHFGLELMHGVQEEQIPYLGHWQGRKVMLLELPHGNVPVGAQRLTQWLLDNEVMPLIAHPERNRGFIRAPAQLKTFLDQGCLLQITAASLTGRFGAGPRELARNILTEGRASILATDAHHPEHRPPALTEALRVASDLIGEARAQALVKDNPQTMCGLHFE